ncbi:hypothetical protein Daus18300_010616 [Diaporthe australafricana]|uniref:Heterokaryon incompatibility domain-containing protein n=1 Tax=Diaporthe australafricana TaxID=127596 RepID=A0ABR3W9W7_9PEZI
MASTVEIESFRHEGLPDPRTYIRLLEACSVDETRDVPVHCKLTVHCRQAKWLGTKAAKYTAMSYTWGDPQQLAVILVNGKRMEVRRNCEYVLKQACWDKGRYFWIDAICINQTDNEEKSFQVAMMGDIYEKAGRVLACLGRHEDDSEFLFEMMRKHHHAWKNFYGPLIEQSLRLTAWTRFMGEAAVDRMYDALVKFLQRPYFYRVWVHQELFHGKNIQICCEGHKVKGLWLRALYQAFRKFPKIQPLGSNMPGRPPPHPDLRTTDVQFLTSIAIAPKTRISLSDMTLFVEKWQCEDPRDRVYGTLSMIEWEGKEPIQPDYSKDSFGIGLEVLRRLGNDAEFETLFWQILQVVKILIPDLISDPSRMRAIQERRSGDFKVPPAIPTPNPGNTRTMTMIRAWGKRLCLHNASWQLQRQPSSEVPDYSGLELCNGESFPSDGLLTVVQKWHKGHNWDTWSMDILLPQEAQHGDWLLAPSFTYSDARSGTAKESRLAYESRSNPVRCDMVFVARKADDGRLRLVGQGLFVGRNHWPQRKTWEKVWGDGGSKYGVHLDADDAIVLACASGWRSLVLDNGFVDFATMSESNGLRFDESRKLEAKQYFETKVFGESSYSHATPM